MNLWTLAPVVQKLDSAIHWIHHHSVDNAIGFLNTYPTDLGCSNVGKRYLQDKLLSNGEVLGKPIAASVIQWIEIYPVDSAIHQARVVQTLDGAKITIQRMLNIQGKPVVLSSG